MTENPNRWNTHATTPQQAPSYTDPEGGPQEPPTS